MPQINLPKLNRAHSVRDLQATDQVNCLSLAVTQVLQWPAHLPLHNRVCHQHAVQTAQAYDEQTLRDGSLAHKLVLWLCLGCRMLPCITCAMTCVCCLQATQQMLHRFRHGSAAVAATAEGLGVADILEALYDPDTTELVLSNEVIDPVEPNLPGPVLAAKQTMGQRSLHRLCWTAARAFDCCRCRPAAARSHPQTASTAEDRQSGAAPLL